MIMIVCARRRFCNDDYQMLSAKSGAGAQCRQKVTIRDTYRVTKTPEKMTKSSHHLTDHIILPVSISQGG